jgi:glycosidase
MNALKRTLIPLAALGVAIVAELDAQSVAIRFRYQPQAVYPRVHFPGQFNNWGPNSAGTIAAGTPSQADSLEAATGLWVKTLPLPFGTYQYKIYRQLSANPTDWSWIPDPLNRVVIGPDQNSQFVVDSLVLFEVCPVPYATESGPGGTVLVVNSGLPRLSGGVFQPPGAPSPALEASIDGIPVPSPSSWYDAVTGIFSYSPPAGLADGMHTFVLRAAAGGQSRADSVRFEVRARPVQIQTPPFSTRKPVYITAGIVFKPDASGPDSTVASVTLSVNGVPKTVPATNGTFADSTFLIEGLNLIRVSTPNGRDSVLVTRIVDHAPRGRVQATDGGGSVTLSGSASTDPDGETLTDFRWYDDPALPLGLAGQTGVSASVVKPPAGEYHCGLIVTDPDGNADTTRAGFRVGTNGSITTLGYADNPDWARLARVYFLFPKAASVQGTLAAAALRLQSVKDLGFSVIWLMPVMKNAFPINNGIGPGYNITDFYSVAPEYGTNQDMKDFVDQTHALGMKVILDVTPNHSSRFHPWAVNARALRSNSPYWNWYQHSIIPHNDNGLGQSLDAEGFNYYSGFGDQLLNFNWTDVDFRAEMVRVYRYWIQQFGLDGYRLDVYWGPHRRYGEQYMGNPVRDALKHLKPDILLLAEDDGTGPGTETIYADFTGPGTPGGVDAAYDFKLYFNQIRGFAFNATAVNNLQSDVDNGGYYPGPNALYMRFMESQDEDRITYFYSSAFSIDSTTTFMRTMPMASVLFTVPGFPMIWNGQEVGWGYGIGGAKEARNRSVIDWNMPGKRLLSPHYQQLAHIRAQFPAFTQHKLDSNGDGSINGLDVPNFVRVPGTDPLFYAFTRPFYDQNGLTVVNFGVNGGATTLDLTAGNAILFTGGIQSGSSYYLNNLTANTRQLIAGSALGSVVVSLPGYGTGIFTVSTTADTLRIQNPVLSVEGRKEIPREFALRQNFPNPFNPATSVLYQLPEKAHVRLAVFDLLGRRVATLVDGEQPPGTYTASWDAGSSASGVYFCRLQAGTFNRTVKMILQR